MNYVDIIMAFISIALCIYFYYVMISPRFYNKYIDDLIAKRESEECQQKLMQEEFRKAIDEHCDRKKESMLSGDGK